MRSAIGSGRALAKFAEIIAAQGGDARIVENQDLLPTAPLKEEFTSDADGFVVEVAPRVVGHGVIALRGGRRTMEDVIDPSVGFIITAKPGDRVRRGQTLATIHALDDSGLREGRRALRDAIAVGGEAPSPLELISVKVTGEGTQKWERPDA
jgi:thymidine phosphorylase